MLKDFKEDYLPYKVGGLLYSPASRKGISEKIINGEYGKLSSLALCLEDSISDDSLKTAEGQLQETLSTLNKSSTDLPLLFVRVRSVDHLVRMHNLLGNNELVLTGYILPKFDLNNCESYCRLIRDYNSKRAKKLYIMPILESKSIADVGNRVNNLLKIKRHLDGISDYVLNIRVGGNDFCNLYGLRRSETQNIYQIGVIRDTLVDIINIFSSDYIVSGPVWEYFGKDTSEPWAIGLRKEIEMDRLNGFIGKTAIHPSQIPIINESLIVRKRDYDDANTIINWTSQDFAVAKSVDGQRMNEVKCHYEWAKRTLILAEIYGIRE